MTGIALASQAQKGSVLLQGDLNFNSSKAANDDKQTSFEINPTVGYQFTEHWTVGVTGGVGSTKYKPVVGSDSKSTNYAAGIFGRYTQPLGGIFSIYGQADVVMTGSENTAGVEFRGFGIGITPAVQLNVKNGFALNFGFGGIGFNSNKVKGANDSNTSFGLNFGEQFHFGISKNFLPRKK